MHGKLSYCYLLKRTAFNGLRARGGTIKTRYPSGRRELPFTLSRPVDAVDSQLKNALRVTFQMYSRKISGLQNDSEIRKTPPEALLQVLLAALPSQMAFDSLMPVC